MMLKDHVRLGLRTFFSRNDMWRLEGYGAYGFKDHKFKYGIGGRYMFDKITDLQLVMALKRYPAIGCRSNRGYQ